MTGVERSMIDIKGKKESAEQYLKVIFICEYMQKKNTVGTYIKIIYTYKISAKINC